MKNLIESLRIKIRKNLIENLDNDIEQEQPDFENDAIIGTKGNYYTLSYAGLYLGRSVEIDPLLSLLKKKMKEGNYFPTIWYISDHGNFWPIDIHGNEIKENKESKWVSTCSKHQKYEPGCSFCNKGIKKLNEDFERNKIIAGEILKQLGGQGKLIAMTGAYNFVAHENGVSFKIKNPKANYIKIILNGKDNYDVEIGRIRGVNYKVLVSEADVPAENLKQLIEKSTGMYLSLFENFIQKYLVKELYDDLGDEGPQPGDAEYHNDFGHKMANNGQNVFANIDWETFYKFLVRNTKIIKDKEDIGIAYNVGDFTDDDGMLSHESLKHLEDHDLIYIFDGFPIIDNPEYLDYQSFYNKAKEIWLKDVKHQNDPSHESSPYYRGNEDSMLENDLPGEDNIEYEVKYDRLVDREYEPSKKFFKDLEMATMFAKEKYAAIRYTKTLPDGREETGYVNVADPSHPLIPDKKF